MQIDITRLLLFGLLYCKGSHEEKTQRFWDVLQQPGMDQISWEDKELTVAGTWFLEVATHWTHVWTQQKMQEEGKLMASKKVKPMFNDMKKIKAAADEIYENFLDDCFGTQSRVYRDKFIKEVEKNCQYLFKPEELR